MWHSHARGGTLDLSDAAGTKQCLQRLIGGALEQVADVQLEGVGGGGGHGLTERRGGVGGEAGKLGLHAAGTRNPRGKANKAKHNRSGKALPEVAGCAGAKVGAVQRLGGCPTRAPTQHTPQPRFSGHGVSPPQRPRTGAGSRTPQPPHPAHVSTCPPRFGEGEATGTSCAAGHPSGPGGHRLQGPLPSSASKRGGKEVGGESSHAPRARAGAPTHHNARPTPPYPLSN
jgi:hypothetical protein